MGFPIAAGVAAGLARREAPLLAKGTEFLTHAQRFREHAAAYVAEDAAGARRFAAYDSDLAESDAAALGSDVRLGGGAVIVWCSPLASGGYRCTNLFENGGVVRYPSATDRTGVYLP